MNSAPKTEYWIIAKKHKDSENNPSKVFANILPSAILYCVECTRGIKYMTF